MTPEPSYELGLEGRYAAARAQRHRAQRAAQRDPLAVGRLGDRGAPDLPARRTSWRRSRASWSRGVGPAADACAAAGSSSCAIDSAVSWLDRARACGGQRRPAAPRPRASPGRRGVRRPADACPPSPAASSGSAAGLPSSVARSIQRGPLMPTTRDGWVRSPSGAAPTLADQLGAPAALALGGGAAAPGRPRRRSAGATSDQRSPLRGAAKARSSSAPSGPASTTDCTSPLASSTWSRSSRSGSGAISSEPRSTRSTSSSAAGRRTSNGPSARRSLGVGRRPRRRRRRTSSSTASACALRRNFTCVRSLGRGPGLAVPKPPVEP